MLLHNLGLQHFINKRHENGAHLLNDVLQPVKALRLLRLCGLPALAEDILGFAVAFPTGLDMFVSRAI